MKIRSIKYRIAISAFLLQGLLLLLVLPNAFSRYHEGNKQQITQTELAQIKLLNLFARTTLLTGEYDSFQPHLEAIKQDPHVVTVALVDYKNVVVASSNPSIVGKKYSASINGKESYWRNQVIENESGSYGALAVEFSSSRAMILNRSVWRNAIALGTAGILISVALSLLVGHFLSIRIGKITSAAKRVAQGDLDTKTRLDGHDEIAVLGQTFDGMTSQIYEAQKQLKQQNEAIKSRERHLSMTLNSIADAVIATDAQGVITIFNNVAASLTEIAKNEAIKKSLDQVFKLINSQSGKPVTIHLDKVLRGGKIVGFPENIVLMSANGKQRQIAYSVAPIEDESDNVLGAIIVFRDVTEEYQLKLELKNHRAHLEDLVDIRTDELKRANKEMEAFCYSVSHDLRSPLRSIDGFSRMIQEDYEHLLDTSGMDNLNRVRLAARRMGCLIDDLLMLSRITREEMSQKQVNLSKKVSQILTQLKDADSQRKISCDIQENVIANVDDRLIHILLENLLQNAWKYTTTQAHPSIKFGAIELKGEIVYFVQDNGVGFDMRFKDKLFLAFQRLHPNEFEGTGIGLATAQRIVQRHGGKIWAEGKVDEGAIIYFTIDSIIVSSNGLYESTDVVV